MKIYPKLNTKRLKKAHQLDMDHNLHLRLIFLLVYWEQSSQHPAGL